MVMSGEYVQIDLPKPAGCRKGVHTHNSEPGSSIYLPGTNLPDFSCWFTKKLSAADKVYIRNSKSSGVKIHV